MKKSKWIWYYGDFELYHTMRMMSRREQRGLYHPPMWRTDGIHPYLFVYKIAVLDDSETMRVYFNGTKASVTVNGKRFDPSKRITLDAGRNFVKINIFNPNGLPAVFVKGDTFASDESWYIGTYGGNDLHVGTNKFYTSVYNNPEKYFFSYTTVYPVSFERIGKGILFDFGKETFGKLRIINKNTNGTGKVAVVYGESREEALDKDNAVISDIFEKSHAERSYTARACRYVFVEDKNVDISLDYEYVPLKYRGKFKSKDKKLNKILDVCAYTLHLNTRECFLDGIKRDRWVWGGDAYQSFFVNYYLFNDYDAVRRTVISLLGGEPFTHFTNTIPDYTFLIIIGIYEYYLHSNDRNFLEFVYEKFEGILSLVNKRLDSRGLFCGARGDWIFIDWADTAKKGAVCAEQILLCAAYESAAKCAEALGDNGATYIKKAADLRDTVNKLYWDDARGAYIDAIDDPERVGTITRHANILALLFGVADGEKIEKIKQNVIKNDDIPAITTPYFKFFELDAMCRLGEFGYVADTIRSYWGGMLDLGATTIWEEYDPKIENKTANYAMYGSKYGKSLCHAWGASPIYLLGRYALGVYPTDIGYSSFNVEPRDIGVGPFSGRVPIGEKDGFADVTFDGEKFTVLTNVSGGTLICNGKKTALTAGQTTEI